MVKLCIMAETLEHTADIFLNDRKTNKNSDKGLTNPSHCAAAFATDYF